MPYSQELGMRVYDPEEGAQIGAGIGEAFNRAMLAAQQRKLSEREIQLQELQQRRLEKAAAEQATYMVRRQQGMEKVQQRYKQLVDSGIPDFLASRQSFMENLGDVLAGAKPDEIASIEKSDTGAYIREAIAKMADVRQREASQLKKDMFEKGLEQKKSLTEKGFNLKIQLADKESEEKQLDRESRERIADKKDTFESKIETLSKLQIAADAAMDSGDEALYKETKAKLDAARALTPGGRAMGESAEPVVKDINGVKIAYVPGSKNIHIIPNEPSKKAFLSKSIPLLIRDGIKPEDAVDKLGKAFDLMNRGGTAAPAATPSPAVKVGTIVKQNGKRYRFDGTKYVEIP